MSAAKTTPGPWTVNDHEQIVGSNGQIVVYELNTKVGDHQLMVAALDLLEALTMVRDADDDCKQDGLPTIPHAARAKIDAAIKKATGETS